MRGVVLLVGVCACKQWYGLEPPVLDAGTASDRDSAPDVVDAFVVVPDTGNCWSIPDLAVSFCRDQPLSGMMMITANETTDTTNDGADCKPTTSSAVCVIAADTITLQSGHKWRFKGARPVILLAKTISVLGELNAASNHGGDSGPGAQVGGCDDGTVPINKGGGQGGSFGGQGGDGGDQQGSANSRGLAGAPLQLTMFRGGCHAEDGGGATNPNAAGGGAIALIANSIVVGTGATINASGAGGDGGNGPDDGGGGGGSGGMIVLEAPNISLAADSQIFANGGHGGGGASSVGPGSDGTDPADATSGGTGGNGNSTAGDGAPGYPSATRNGTSATAAADGGGGGGGGAGVIRVYLGTLTSGQVSPPPS